MVAVKSLFFATLIAAVSAGTINFRRDVPTVEADIAKISEQVTALDTSITNFPDSGGSLLDALAINTAAGDLVTTIDTATTDTKATTDVSEDDATAIIGDVNGFKPAILDSLVKIVAKKPAFAALPIDVNSLVLQDLKNLQTSTSAFEAALIAAAPEDLKADAQAIADEIDAAFVTAVAAYS